MMLNYGHMKLYLQHFGVNVALKLADDEHHVCVHGRKDTWELISTTTTACSSQFPRSPAIDFNKHVS